MWVRVSANGIECLFCWYFLEMCTSVLKGKGLHSDHSRQIETGMSEGENGVWCGGLGDAREILISE